MEERPKYTRILVPVDGSSESLCAVDLAGDIALMMHAVVYLLYVSPFDKRTDMGDVRWLPKSIVQPAAEEAHEIFAAAEVLLPEGVACDRFHRSGVPAEVILRFIDEMDIGLVIIGGRKHSRMSGIFLGSVTQTVLEHAHSSVLIAGSTK